MKKIAVEEHFWTDDFRDYLRSNWSQTPVSASSPGQDEINKLLVDFDQRIKGMNSSGIEGQILTLGFPGVEGWDVVESIKWSKKTNDDLATLIQSHPGRFYGLAAIPVQDPKAAVQEMERAVKKLGLKGVQINSHVRGEYLDDRKYWSIFEQAERLEIPIYIHPRTPSPDMEKPYKAYPGLSAAMLGFGAEVHLHVLRLILSGLFDEFPKLKVVIGHMGEALPYWLWRIDNHFDRTELPKRLGREPSQYFKDNFMITTSGMFWQPAFLCAYLTLGADNIMFAVDYPHESNEVGVKFIEEIPVSDKDREKICHINAENTFKL